MGGEVTIQTGGMAPQLIDQLKQQRLLFVGPRNDHKAKCAYYQRILDAVSYLHIPGFIPDSQASTVRAKITKRITSQLRKAGE